MTDDDLLLEEDPAPWESRGDDADVRAALLLAGPRVRTVDEHMFRPFGDAAPESFRLQFFTGPGLRPVAVATQTPDEGASLTNRAESFAGAVWRALCPEDPQPPVWVQRHVYEGGFGFEAEHFELVVFDAVDAQRHRLAGPKWSPISPEELARLVGGPVDEERGAGYVPREPDPEPEPRFEVAPVAELPDPMPFREACMTGALPEGYREQRQAAPVRGGWDCCWYHGGDWHVVSELAIELLAEGLAAGVAAEDLYGFADARAKAAGVGQWERQALDSLFALSVAIQPGADAYTNGQHRARALIDAGVSRTVVLRELWPDRD